MINNNLSEDILRNPHYLDLKDSGQFKNKWSIKKLPVIIVSILSILPLFLLYTISVGFIIGGFNHVSNNIFHIGKIDLKVFFYNFILGILGIGLIVIAFYLTGFLIRLIRR